MFLREKLLQVLQINVVQTHGQTDGQNRNTEGPILVTSPCVASFSLDREWSNIFLTKGDYTNMREYFSNISWNDQIEHNGCELNLEGNP